MTIKYRKNSGSVELVVLIVFLVLMTACLIGVILAPNSPQDAQTTQTVKKTEPQAQPLVAVKSEPFRLITVSESRNKTGAILRDIENGDEYLFWNATITKLGPKLRSEAEKVEKVESEY